MGNKKKKYNARFPPARIKKIMQTDEEVGKIAAPVPVVISRALELFLESIITESVAKANEYNAKTLTSSHIKSVIQSNTAFDFLKNQVTLVPDLNTDGADTSVNERTSSGANSAQLNAAGVSSTSDSASATPSKKRGRVVSATVTLSTANTQDPANPDLNPNKKRRGRPRKIKPPPDDGVTKCEPTVNPCQTLSTTTNLPKQEMKQEVKNEMLANGPTQPDQAEYKPSSVEHPQPVPDPQRLQQMSIFSTDSTLLSKSEYTYPTAHSTSVMSRYAAGNTPVMQFGYPKGNFTTPANMQSMYANLSPTSQPMDLSTKSFLAHTDVTCSGESTTVSAPSSTHNNGSNGITNTLITSTTTGPTNPEDDDYDI